MEDLQNKMVRIIKLNMTFEYPKSIHLLTGYTAQCKFLVPEMPTIARGELSCLQEYFSWFGQEKGCFSVLSSN